MFSASPKAVCFVHACLGLCVATAPTEVNPHPVWMLFHYLSKAGPRHRHRAGHRCAPGNGCFHRGWIPPEGVLGWQKEAQKALHVLGGRKNGTRRPARRCVKGSTRAPFQLCFVPEHCSCWRFSVHKAEHLSQPKQTLPWREQRRDGKEGSISPLPFRADALSSNPMDSPL